MTADALPLVDLDAAIDIDLESFAPSELGAGAEDPRVVRERSTSRRKRSTRSTERAASTARYRQRDTE